MPAELVDFAAVSGWIHRYPGRSRSPATVEEIRSALEHALEVFEEFPKLGIARQRVIVDMILTSGHVIFDEARDVIVARGAGLTGGGASACEWVDE